jgi:hypothetical protein
MTAQTRVRTRDIGSQVDDVREQGKIAHNVGVTWIVCDPNNPHAFEIKHGELTSLVFGVAVHAWTGSQNDPLAAK